MPYVNNAAGFIYNADMAEEYGITLSEHPDLAELEAAAAILAAHGKYLLLPSASWMNGCLNATANKTKKSGTDHDTKSVPDFRSNCRILLNAARTAA